MAADPPGSELEMECAFLRCAQQSAMARFATTGMAPFGCHTVGVEWIASRDAAGCDGSILLHVSLSLVDAWMSGVAGSFSQRRQHVIDQLHLVVEDLAQHDMHGYLALTRTQRDVYELDLVQLVAESLHRTTFDRLGRDPEVHWEGTFVKSLQPLASALVVSIGLAAATEPR